MIAPQNIRVVESPIGPVIPVTDIIDLIGYSRSGISHAIKGYKEKISPHETFVTLPTPGGPQPFQCLDREGMDYLFAIIHPSKSKIPLDELLEFRRSVLSKFGTGSMGLALPAPAKESFELDEVIAYDLQEAKEIARLTDTDPKTMQAAVLKKHGYPELAEVVRQKIPSVIQHGETGWFIPTQLGHLCGLTAEQFNWWLHNHGFQYRDGSVWRLTPQGEIHGEERVYEVFQTGHKEIRIRWRESILYASGLKRPVAEDQIALPAPARA